MKTNQDTEIYVNLTEMGLPQVRLYKDGRIYHEMRGEFIHPQKNGHLELLSPITNDRV